MKISVKNLEGRTLVFEVEPSMTVEKLKGKIAELNGSQPDQQRLIFKGKHLQDGKTLNEIGVVDGSEIHLVVRTQGGIFVNDIHHLYFGIMVP